MGKYHVEIMHKQESIPVRCVLPAWKLYVLQFQWPLPDVARGQTDACENITFPQLHLRAVNIQVTISLLVRYINCLFGLC